MRKCGAIMRRELFRLVVIGVRHTWNHCSKVEHRERSTILLHYLLLFANRLQ
ncbi:hypothetical protein X765_32365 [Mesorhizobium sp. LSHC440B00]|nr:hypothetical protein X765_32365 [Mesorhizobium sp. LSHC440B00]ESX25638.1 hypothetical protein X764_32610 [Mesorhizobium sp. LSHC440A00]